MSKNRKDPLQGVLIHPAFRAGLKNGPIPYSHGAVNNDEALAELRRIRTLLEYLPEIAESLTRLEVICMEIATSLPSLDNIQSVPPISRGRKQDQARQLLVDLLTDNPKGVKVERIMSEAARRGISMVTMRRAKKGLGLKAKKRGTSWWWKWPDRQ